MISPNNKFTLLAWSCLIWMIVSLALSFVFMGFFKDDIPRAGHNHLVYLFGCIAVTAFGLQWKRTRLVSPDNLLIAAFWFYYFIGFLTRSPFFGDDYSAFSVYLALFGLLSAVAAIKCARYIFKPGTVASQEMVRVTPRPAWSKPRAAIKRVKLLLPLFVFVSAAAGLSWFYMIGVVPIFSNDVEHARIELARGTFVLRQFMSLGVAPFWVSLAYGGTRRFGKPLIYASFLILSFLLIAQGYRSFLLSFWLVSFLIGVRRTGGGTPIRKILLIGGIVIGFALVFGVYRYQTSATADVSRDAFMVASENFYARPEATDFIVREFPAHRPFQNGYFYVMGLGFLLPGQQKSPGNWLKEDVFNMDFAGAGLNPGIIGEFYLNFDVYGVFLGMFLYGLVLWLLWDNSFSRPSELRITIKCMAFFYFLLAVSPGISTSLVSLGWYGGTILLAGLLIQTRARFD